MSVKLMSAVWENGPENSTDRFVLLTLANYANDAGAGVYPSYATIAERCAVSRRTAIRAVESLIEQGYLVRRRRKSDGKFTSSEYKINPRKLEISGDTVSPQEQIDSDTESPRGDSVSLGWCQDDTRVVTQSHQGSDTVSPNPLSDPSIDPSQEGEIARARTSARKPSPPPPKVQTRIPDRTPAGFQAGNGYHPPPDEPIPAGKPTSTADEIAMVNALATVTGLGGKLNFGRLLEFTRELAGSQYTPEQIRLHFGRDDPGPGVWWYWRDDWRGRTTEKHQAEPPTIAVIRERVSLAVNQPAATVAPQARELTMTEKIQALTGKARRISPGGV